MTKMSPDQWKKKILAAAADAIAKDPTKAHEILAKLYAQAQTDFETQYTTHFKVVNGVQFRFLQKSVEGHNPKMS